MVDWNALEKFIIELRKKNGKLGKTIDIDDLMSEAWDTQYGKGTGDIVRNPWFDEETIEAYQMMKDETTRSKGRNLLEKIAISPVLSAAEGIFYDRLNRLERGN